MKRNLFLIRVMNYSCQKEPNNGESVLLEQELFMHLGENVFIVSMNSKSVKVLSMSLIYHLPSRSVVNYEKFKGEFYV